MPDGFRWRFEQLNKNVFRASINYRRNKEFEAWFLITSDRHWDNPDSDEELQIKHLKQALERGAGILDLGDFFCLMQGKYDKRSSKEKVRPEHQKDNYLDAVISDGASFLEPYAKNFICIATGNHEASIQERHGTNPIDRLVERLQDRTGAFVKNGTFSGWLIFQFIEDFDSKRPCSYTTTLHYDHGYGGGGPVTADMIQHQRRAVYLPDADIICSGHTHDQWVREFARVRLRHTGEIKHDIQTHIKAPTYKDEYKLGAGGWAAATKGMPPKPKGAFWLRFYYDWSHRRVLHEVIQAR